MKKFRKILSAVSAAVLCALPLINCAAVNAASESEKINTYRVYVDVKENSGVCKCIVSSLYDGDNMRFQETKIGDLGGEVSNTSVGNQYVECYYTASGNLARAGTLFTMKYISSNTYEETEKDFKIYSENSNGVKLSSDLISRTAVLVGDADGDGRVFLNDVVCIEQFIGNPENYPLTNVRAADVNNDGVITDEDALLIQKYNINLIKHF